MRNEDFAAVLRSLEAPYFLDGGGSDSLLGTQYKATTPDGLSVTIVRLHDRIVASMHSVNSFIGMLGSRAHQATEFRELPGSLLGAGVTAGGDVFVVGARVDGVTLADRLAHDATLSSRDVREIALQGAALLERFYTARIAHGLVMPQAIVLDAQGHVTLRWGGLFTALRASGLPASDIARLLQFSNYLAPELLDGALESTQSDVFSFGATLYEALTGRPPFGGRTTATIMAAVLADGGQTNQPTEGDALRSVVLRAIERDPRDRWRDATQFRRALAPQISPIPAPVARRSGCLPSLVLLCVALVAWVVLH
jgi:serine/threonine protein kinase